MKPIDQKQGIKGFIYLEEGLEERHFPLHFKSWCFRARNLIPYKNHEGLTGKLCLKCNSKLA